MIIRLYNIIIKLFPFADKCQKQHTMVCKACNSHVHNTNDMTLVHLNECFNGNLMMIIVGYKITCIVLVVKP